MHSGNKDTRIDKGVFVDGVFGEELRVEVRGVGEGRVESYMQDDGGRERFGT